MTEYKITLSTTEPNNNVGLIKLRHADVNSQAIVAQIVENGQPKRFEGLQPYFCLMAQEVTGQGVSEEPVKTFDGAKGTLKYTVSDNAMQMIGRNEAYFSFRKELSNGKWAEQFSTRSFYYTVEKSIYTQPFKDSNYWFTFKELYRLFNDYIESGKLTWEDFMNTEHGKWKDFIDQNREIIESVDPGGKVLIELITARGGAQTLGERLNSEKSDITAQLADTKKHTITKKINPSKLPLPMISAKGDGATDDTIAFLSAINMLTDKTDSVIDFSTRNGGVLELDEGFFLIDQIIMKSNITIKGQGQGKTILIPKFTDVDKYLFDVLGTDTKKRLVNFEIKDLSIMPNASYQFAIQTNVANRYKASIINFSYTSSCRISNVAISGFGGHAIKMLEHYDSHLDNIQVLGCGDDIHNSLLITVGTSDGTNALHITNPRFEGCTPIYFYSNNGKFQREIQIIGGKFEDTGIKYAGTSNVNILGTHFTWNKPEPLIDISISSTESYGLKFASCSFLSIGNGKLISGIDSAIFIPQFIGCNIKGFRLVAINGAFDFSNCEFYDCSAPILIVNSGSKINNNTFMSSKGIDGEYLVKVLSSCTVMGNKIKGFVNKNLKGILITGHDNIINFNEVIGGSQGIYVESGTGNAILNNNATVSGKSSTWYADNQYQGMMDLHIPHNAENRIGNIKYDVNTKIPYIYNGTSWGIVLNKQCTWVAPVNTDAILDLKTQFNELLTKLVSSGIMKIS